MWPMGGTVGEVLEMQGEVAGRGQISSKGAFGKCTKCLKDSENELKRKSIRERERDRQEVRGSSEV